MLVFNSISFSNCTLNILNQCNQSRTQLRTTRTTERPKKIVAKKKFFLDVRLMADPLPPVRGRPLWPTPPLPYDRTSLMDGP